jgi:hypothetical protein
MIEKLTNNIIHTEEHDIPAETPPDILEIVEKINELVDKVNDLARLLNN